MKTNCLSKLGTAAVVAGLLVSAGAISAQNMAAPTPPPVSAPAPQLAYGVPQVLQLAQAKIGDDTIIAYINNSRINYALDANQIIYLRQQGVSDVVVTAMLNQPKAGGVAPAPATFAAQPAAPAPAPAPVPAPTVTYVQTQPTVTYVQTAPPVTYYYSNPYYYPSYAYYPPVSFSIGLGWGGGWRGGACYRGGWRGHR